MATVINGILQRRLPWGLILLGVFMVVAVELLGIRSLSFAVGFYLSIATTLAIFAGGVVRWLVESRAQRERAVPWKKAKSAPVHFIPADSLPPAASSACWGW